MRWLAAGWRLWPVLLLPLLLAVPLATGLAGTRGEEPRQKPEPDCQLVREQVLARGRKQLLRQGQGQGEGGKREEDSRRQRHGVSQHAWCGCAWCRVNHVRANVASSIALASEGQCQRVPLFTGGRPLHVLQVQGKWRAVHVLTVWPCLGLPG